MSSLAKMAMNRYLATAGQLHELELAQYLKEKHVDLERMAAPPRWNTARRDRSGHN